MPVLLYMQVPKAGIGFISTESWAADSIVSGPFQLKFELMQDIMHVLATVNFKKDPRKSGDVDFRRSMAANSMVRCQNWLKFELIQDLMQVLFT